MNTKIDTKLSSALPIAIVHCCIDYRFHSATMQFVSGMIEGQPFDVFSGAGGCKSMLEDNQAIQQWVLQNDRVAVEYHHIQQIILINHMDCAAYGGSAKFMDSDQEQTMHASELQAAVRILHYHFPQVKIRTFLASIENGTVKFTAT